MINQRSARFLGLRNIQLIKQKADQKAKLSHKHLVENYIKDSTDYDERSATK